MFLKNIDSPGLAMTRVIGDFNVEKAGVISTPGFTIIYLNFVNI